MDYLETIAQKRLETTSKLERDFDNTKANSTVKASSKEIIKALENLKATHPKELKPVIEGLKKLAEQFGKLSKDFPSIEGYPKSTTINNLSDLKPWLDGIVVAIEQLKLNPRIEVTQPDIKIPESKIDFSPLTKAIESQKLVKDIELGDYKAQDLVEDEAFQYIGFMSPGGNWYIIEHDVAASSLRYKFGTKNYKSNWRSHKNQPYKLMNEAIHEIQT